MSGVEQQPQVMGPESDRYNDLRHRNNDEPFIDSDYSLMVDTSENTAKGVAYLQERYSGDIPTQAANYALALVVTLKHTEAAMSTGKDVSILGVPSQLLLRDVLSRLPLGLQDSDPAGDMLFEEFKDDIGRATPGQFKELIIEFLRVSDAYWQSFDEKTAIETKSIRDNFHPILAEFKYLAEGYVDKALHGYLLPHEGGERELFEPDLFYELCEPYYLRMVFSATPKERKLTGFRGKNIMRLMNEARSLDVPGANEIALQ